MDMPSIPSGEAVADTLPDEAAVLTREESDPPGLAFLPNRRGSFDDEPTRKAHAPKRRRPIDIDDDDTEKWASSPGSKPKH